MGLIGNRKFYRRWTFFGQPPAATAPIGAVASPPFRTCLRCRRWSVSRQERARTRHVDRGVPVTPVRTLDPAHATQDGWTGVARSGSRRPPGSPRPSRVAPGPAARREASRRRSPGRPSAGTRRHRPAPTVGTTQPGWSEGPPGSGGDGGRRRLRTRRRSDTRRAASSKDGANVAYDRGYGRIDLDLGAPPEGHAPDRAAPDA